MSRDSSPRRLKIVITDEESGEEVARANGVQTMIILFAPDTMSTDAYRPLLLGDADLSVEMLFSVFGDIADKIRQGTTVDLTNVLDDQLLLQVTEDLIIQ